MHRRHIPFLPCSRAYCVRAIRIMLCYVMLCEILQTQSPPRQGQTTTTTRTTSLSVRTLVRVRLQATLRGPNGVPRSRRERAGYPSGRGESGPSTTVNKIEPQGLVLTARGMT